MRSLMQWEHIRESIEPDFNETMKKLRACRRLDQWTLRYSLVSGPLERADVCAECLMSAVDERAI
jgi:hypothetical protein